MKDPSNMKTEMIENISTLRQKINELEHAKEQLELTVEAQKKTERRYRKVFHTNKDSISINRLADGMYISINEGFTKLMGYEEADIIGRTSFNLNIWDNIEDRQRLLTGLRIDGEVKNLEAYFCRKDGSLIPGLLSASILDLDGIPHILSVTRDITDRKQTEEALRVSEEKYRLVVENVGEGIFIAQDGMLLFLNPKSLEIFGYPEEVLTSKPFVEFIHPEDQEMVSDRHIRRLAGEQDTPVYPFKVITQDGSIKWVEIHAVAIKWEGKPAILNFISDITERKMMDEALQTSQLRLSEAIDLARIVYWELDPITEDFIFNDSFYAFYGTTAELEGGYRMAVEEYGKRFVHPDDMHIFHQASEIHLLNRNREFFNEIEHRIVRRDGAMRHILVRIRSSKSTAGRFVRIYGANQDISESIYAAEALKESRQRLSDIIDFLPDATFVIDQEGKVITWNRAIEIMTRVKAQDMIGKGNYEYTLPFYGERRPMLIDLVLKPHEETERLYMKTERDDTSLTGEAYMPALRGGEAYLFGKASILRDSQGHILGAIESIRDITDRRQAEVKYRSIFENAMEGIVQTTPAGRYLSANPAAARILGYESPEEMIEIIQDIAKQQYVDSARRKQLLKVLKEKGRVKNFEIHAHRKDGKKLWLSFSARSVRDKDGHDLYFEGTYQDITKRKKAEDALKDSEERLRSIIEASNAGILMLSMDGQILFANPHMTKMLGYEHQEFIGTHYIDYVHPSEKDKVPGILRRIEETNIVEYSSERRYQRKDGSDLWGYVGGRRLRRIRGEDCLILVVSDMTQLKQAEKEKKTLENHLRQAQKMEAIGTLAGGIAHDFNNILASVIGYTELSIKEVREEKQRGYLTKVLMASERAKNLVSQILAFSRQQEQERHPIDIRSMVKEALKMLRSTIPSTIQIKEAITPGAAVVSADPTQIHQIIMNLCTNAAHAMRDEGGVLEVTLSNIEVTLGLPMIHSDLKAGAYVLLTVSDTGHGIDPDIREKIFDPFFTTKKPREGTGLGLSVVYGIVRSYGGAISVQSSLGVGSSFSIYLPLVKPGGTAAEQKQTAQLKGGQEKILFVDDEEFLVELIPDFLKSLGYEVVSTTSSMDALQLYRQSPHGFDLVVTDMTMPHMTGLELSAKMLAIRKDLPIILCTGYHETITTEEVKRQGIKKLVNKPISLTDMGLLIRKTLDE